MVIACLGWGSLIWDPRDLPVGGAWFEDGPLIRVEFSRQSNDGRLTLVIIDSAPEVRSLWATLNSKTLIDARSALMKREGTSKEEYIASWSRGDEAPKTIPGLPEWAAGRDITDVVWTALPSRFADAARAPTALEAVRYLDGLTDKGRDLAEEYIRRAPLQIDTPYRRAIVQELGWTHTPEGVHPDDG